MEERQACVCRLWLGCQELAASARRLPSSCLVPVAVAAVIEATVGLARDKLFGVSLHRVLTPRAVTVTRNTWLPLALFLTVICNP